MTISYPLSFASIPAWAADSNIGRAEARLRFAHYGILRAIADSTVLGEALVLKGGNALDFVWQPNRSTRDLDFSVDASIAATSLGADALRSLLAGSLATAGRALDIVFAVHRVEQQPPGANRTFITYQARIGYACRTNFGSATACGTASRVQTSSPSTSASTNQSARRRGLTWTVRDRSA